MKNMGNTIVTIIGGIIIGLLLIVGINMSVHEAMKPVIEKVAELVNTQGGSDLSEINDKLDSLDKRLAKIEEMATGGGRAAPQRPTDDYTKVYEIPDGKSYVFGNKDAKITIIEFVDFQCPYCARFHTPAMEAAKAYPDDVKFIMKNFPLSFHPQAKSAAKAAMAAGEQGKYFEMAELLFQNIRSLNEETYQSIAKGLGLDVKKFMKDYKEKDAEYEAIIKEDMALGAKVGVRGTPTFYLDGKKTRARTLDAYKTEIDAILKKK